MTTRNHTYHIPYERLMTIATRRGATINDAWLTGVHYDKPRIAISVTEDIAEPIEPVTLTIFADDERYAPAGSKRITTLYDGKGLYRLPTYQGMMARAAMGGVLADVDYRRGRGFDSRHLIYDPLDAAERKVRKQAEQIDTLRARVEKQAETIARYQMAFGEQGRGLDRTKDLLARWEAVAESRLKEVVSTSAALNDAKQKIVALTEQRDDAHDTIESLRGLVDRQAKEHKRLNRHLGRIRSAATMLRRSAADYNIMGPVIAMLDAVDTEEPRS